jgi:hypothetical protein
MIAQAGTLDPQSQDRPGGLAAGLAPIIIAAIVSRKGLAPHLVVGPPADSDPLAP